MVQKALKYSFAAIGLYLGVYYASGAGTLINAGSTGGVSLIKAFQGR
jgi:hypothetical protein